MTIDLKKLFKSTDKENKFHVTLLKAMKENAGKEFDYLKFKQSLKALEELELPEDTRFKSAYATAATMGLTKDKLINSNELFQSALNKEKRSFAEALKNQRENRVTTKKAQRQKLEEKKTSLLEKIEKMKSDIQLIDKKVAEVNTELEQSNDKIEHTRAKFVSSFDQIMETLTKDAQLINEYL